MNLTVIPREKFGKATNGLRKTGLIPAELYGHGIKNEHIAVNAKEFAKVFKAAGESSIVHLVIGSEKKPTLVHDVSRDYFSGEVSHVDFYQVRMDEKIKAHVHIEFLGDAPAVKEQGGFLNKTISEIEVEALPGDLPHVLTLNLETLTELNQSLHVKDIPVPKGVRIMIEPEAVVVTVTPPLKEEEKVEAPVDVSAIKVEGEEKKAERDAEKAEKTKETA